MDDREVYEFYADPANREPVGPPRRLARRPLTSHVPVRFSPDVIAEVKRRADADGRTVSSWIRAVIDRELRNPHVSWTYTGTAATETGA